MPDAPLTQTLSTLPLPQGADLTFWKGEIDRAERASKASQDQGDQNVKWYLGQSPDAAAAKGDYVNVNVDFYQVEQKLSQLFYETPELQLTGTGPLKGQDTVLQAHRDLLHAVLEVDIDILPTVLDAIKACLCVAGTGPVMIGYQPTLREVPAPTQPGDVLGLQASIKVPIHEHWYVEGFSYKKFLKPADLTHTHWDRSPWLGMRFRMTLAQAKREFPDAFAAQPDFEGTTTKDEHVLNQDDSSERTSDMAYVEGQAIWYRAAFYDETAHPELYRELVIIDGLEREARHRDSPHQTIGPNGRMTADSLIGNPIHPLTIRSVPDASEVPSDSQMTRPLVRELCKFRTQMTQERDQNRPRILYDSEKITPDTINKIASGEIGELIPVEGGALAQGIGSIMAQVVQGQSPRQTYLANDIITQDIGKVLAIDATGAGVSADAQESATKTATVDRNRSVRLDAERRQVLRWYLKLVDKVSALVCRYMTPQLAATYIGPEAAQAWGSWNKQATDGRLGFDAKPDSQIRLDAAMERKFALDLYQFTAKDPNVVRIELLKHLFAKAGLDPAKMIVPQLPEKPPEPNIGFTFKGEDLIGPQAPVVFEILAQGGITVSQPARDESAGQLFKQMALGVRDASGKAVPPTPHPQGHGGPADQVRPLSQQSADQTGNRSGRPTQEQVA